MCKCAIYSMLRGANHVVVNIFGVKQTEWKKKMKPNRTDCLQNKQAEKNQ